MRAPLVLVLGSVNSRTPTNRTGCLIIYNHPQALPSFDRAKWNLADRAPVLGTTCRKGSWAPFSFVQTFFQRKPQPHSRTETALESCFVCGRGIFFLLMLESQCVTPSAAGKLVAFLLLFAFSFLLFWSPSSTLNTFPKGIIILLVFSWELSNIYKKHIILLGLIFTFRI